MLLMFVPSFVAAKNDLVIDETGELTSDQLDELNTLCNKLSADHQADICAVIVNSTQGYEIDDYANKIYEEYGYGQGNNYSGILLTVDMETKTYYFTTDIDGICFNYITDYSIDNLGNVFISAYNSYYTTGSELYQAIKAYILEVDRILTSAENGQIIDIVLKEIVVQLKDEEGKPVEAEFEVYDNDGEYWQSLNCYDGYGNLEIAEGKQYTLVCREIDSKYEMPNNVVVNVNSSPVNITVSKKATNYGLLAGIGGGSGLISALIYTGILRGKNKSVRKKYDANTYLRKNSFRLYPNSRDIFLYSQVSKTPIPKNNDNNNHSSGSSHSGGSSFSGSVGSHSGGRGGGHF